LKNYTNDVVILHPSTIRDAEYLAKNLRKQDLMEVEAVGQDPLTSLTYPIHHRDAQTFTLFYGKEPVLMIGTVAESVGLARLWMLASDNAFKRPMKLALLSRKWVDVLHKPYEILYNYVWIENKKAVKLLQHLNCRFDKEYIKKKNLDFVKFSRCKSNKISI
tara:strand:+ start:25 stop:510 length:486 start_codon:yes stop_codon:yes gene_type:complete